MKVRLRDIRTGFSGQAEAEGTVEKAKALDLRQLPRPMTLAIEAHSERARILNGGDKPSLDLGLPYARENQAEGTPGVVESQQAECSRTEAFNSRNQGVRPGKRH